MQSLYSPNCHEAFEDEHLILHLRREYALHRRAGTPPDKPLPPVIRHSSGADILASLRAELGDVLSPAEAELVNPSPRPSSSPDRHAEHEALRAEVKRLFPQRTRGEQLEALRLLLTARGRRPLRTILAPVTDDVHENAAQAASLLRAALQNRTEAEWVALVEQIGDDDLKLAVAKKVYWDYFILGKRHWHGLDYLISEDGDGRVVRWAAKGCRPPDHDMRTALWKMGYPVTSLIDSYPASWKSIRGADKTVVFHEVEVGSGDRAENAGLDLVVGGSSHHEQLGKSRDGILGDVNGLSGHESGEVLPVQTESLKNPGRVSTGLNRAYFERHHVGTLMRRNRLYNPLAKLAR